MISWDKPPRAILGRRMSHRFHRCRCGRTVCGCLAPLSRGSWPSSAQPGDSLQFAMENHPCIHDLPWFTPLKHLKHGDLR